MKVIRTHHLLEVSSDAPVLIPIAIIAIAGAGFLHLFCHLQFPAIIFLYLTGAIITYVLSAFFTSCKTDEERAWLIGYSALWPGLYTILLICNIALLVFNFHVLIFNTHKTLSTKQLFVRKPKLLEDKKMPIDSNMYRNNAECEACHRPV